MKSYTILKAGDIRQPGDEQMAPRSLGGRYLPSHKHLDSPWRPVDLLGHPILAADLCHLQFRRPI